MTASVTVGTNGSATGGAIRAGAARRLRRQHSGEGRIQRSHLQCRHTTRAAQRRRHSPGAMAEVFRRRRRTGYDRCAAGSPASVARSSSSRSVLQNAHQQRQEPDAAQWHRRQRQGLAPPAPRRRARQAEARSANSRQAAVRRWCRSAGDLADPRQREHRHARQGQVSGGEQGEAPRRARIDTLARATCGWRKVRVVGPVLRQSQSSGAVTCCRMTGDAGASSQPKT